MMIKITNVKFEVGKTSIVEDNNKMWEDDIVSTSSRLSWTMDGSTYGRTVEASTVEDAIKEVIPAICLGELLELDLTFEELGLPNVKFETYDDEGFIKSVNDFYNNRHGDIHIMDKDVVMKMLEDKAVSMFDVVVV